MEHWIGITLSLVPCCTKKGVRSKDLSLLHFEPQAVDGLQAPEGLAEPFDLQELHPSPPLSSYLGHIDETKPLSPTAIQVVPVPPVPPK
jgi:hypothetical protein